MFLQVQNILLLVVSLPCIHCGRHVFREESLRNAYAVRPSLCVGIPTQINSLTQGHCEGRPSLGLGTRMRVSTLQKQKLLQTRPQGQAQTRTQGITTVCGIYTGYYWVLPSLTPCFRPGSFPATLAARFRNRSEE